MWLANGKYQMKIKHLKPGLSLKAIPIINRNCEGVPARCVYTGHGNGQRTRDRHLYILTLAVEFSLACHTLAEGPRAFWYCAQHPRDAGGAQETLDSRCLISETRLQVKLCYHTHFEH
ncbi:hypothetical protein CBL_20959 [Carabus blaptoides fortunei]